ncbi:FkbM family methyltransferase [Pedobacter sp. Leaf132]|uniref:FkbM family methyltransferase n=1 Tax=Pedobacter sp. Leaf132 TaxID=2876557 RepID=UPI001E47905D|nr:FkbM family methyltransferase [Pedobacter sp. Leaf132]
MNIDILLAKKIINLFSKYITYRTTSEAEKWQNLFHENDAFIVHGLSNGTRLKLYKDSILSKLIYEGFENKELLFIDKFLKPGDTFFDIGSNIGLHSIFASAKLKKDGYIYAFEPSVKTFNRLNENVSLNNLKSIITTFQMGISDKNETLYLNVSEDGHDAWNSFSKLQHINLSLKEEISVIRLDDFIFDNAIKPDTVTFIKIDVEGWELHVLGGLEKLIHSKDFNPVFLIEFTEENAFRTGYSCRDIYSYLVNKGYKWYGYDELNNEVYESPLKAYYPYENLIALKPERLNNLRIRLQAE